MKDIVFIISILFVNSVYANSSLFNLDDDILHNQKDATEVSVSDNFLALSILPTGIFYEKGFNKKHTFNLQGLLGYNIFIQKTVINGITESQNIYFAFVSQIFTGYRYYYNLQKRYNRYRNIRGNSGNYVTLISGVGFKPLVIANNNNFTVYKYDFILGPAWGIHRTYNKNIDIDFNIGIAYSYNNIDGSGIAPILNFRFGYVFMPKKIKKQ